MAIEDRRLRDREAQRRLITDTARALAEQEGWDAVTTRRLATEIEYSQPVIYKHFTSMDVLAEAVAVEGFGELAAALGAVSLEGEDPLLQVATAYGRFAADNPAVYDAMFTRSTQLRFGTEDAPAPLVSAFARLRDAVATVAGDRDVATLTEVFWSALHGLTTFERNDRLRPGQSDERTALLVAQFQ